MKKFAELGTVHRIEPCQEYPGSWILFFPFPNHPEKMEQSYPTLEEAITSGGRLLFLYEDKKYEYNPGDFSICWKCSDNDPRVGEVWFTGYYIVGKWSIFGNFVKF